jgi:diguanylate cyclase (GGDEF)-like protein
MIMKLFHRRTRRWPRRSTYPLVGLALAIGLLGGLLALHAVIERRFPEFAWVLRELAARPITYGYLLLVAATLLISLGWVIGRKQDRLLELSVTDPLTGLANRRRLLGAMGEELARAARYHTAVTLLLIDVDRLKELNDRAGHGAGDRALQLVAESLRASCRVTDLPARFGGDEFAVLAPSTTAAEASSLAERIRSTLSQLSARGASAPAPERAGAPAPASSTTTSSSGPVPSAAPAATLLTVSMGGADLDSAAAPTIEALQLAADLALYQAKTAGRDRLVLAPSPPKPTPQLRIVPPVAEGEEANV